MDLTLVVVARDEADRIGRCLRSVPDGVERIVVLDAATTDATARVAAGCGARVVVRAWPGHVAQKNHALSLAQRSWVLSLDADEWLSPGAAAEIGQAIADPRGASGFSLPRLNLWLGKPIRGGRWYPDRKVRLVRRGAGRWAGDDPHDRLEVDGVVRPLHGDILHVPYRTVWEHLATIDRYSRIHAASLRARGVRARRWDPWVRPALHFVDSVLLRAAWRDGADGLTLAALGAAHVHLKWSRLRHDHAAALRASPRVGNRAGGSLRSKYGDSPAEARPGEPGRPRSDWPAGTADGADDDFSRTTPGGRR